MPKRLVRIFAILLVPCLLADPSPALALSQGRSPEYVSLASAFNEQALDTPKMIAEFHPAITSMHIGFIKALTSFKLPTTFAHPLTGILAGIVALNLIGHDVNLMSLGLPGGLTDWIYYGLIGSVLGLFNYRKKIGRVLNPPMIEGRRPLLNGIAIVAAAAGISALPAFGQQPAEATLPDPLLERVRSILAQASAKSHEVITDTVIHLRETSFWESRNVTGNDAQQTVAYMNQIVIDVTTWMRANGIETLPAEYYLAAFLRKIRMAQLRSQVANTRRAEDKTALIVDAGIRQLLMDDQQALARIAVAYGQVIRPGQPNAVSQESRLINLDRWKSQSPRLLLHDSFLKAVEDPVFREALIPVLNALGEFTNPFRSLSQLRPIMTRAKEDLGSSMNDLGFALQFGFVNPSNVANRGLNCDIFKLDLRHAEYYRMDDMEATVIPGKSIAEEVTPPVDGFESVPDRRIAVRVESAFDKKLENFRKYLTMDRNRKFIITEKINGMSADARVMLEIAQSHFINKSDTELLEMEQAILAVHEASHFWLRRSDIRYRPNDENDGDISPWTDFGLSQEEWDALEPIVQTDVWREAGTYLAEIAYGPDPFWQMTEMATILGSADRVTALAISRVLRRIAFNFSTHQKIKEPERRVLLEIAHAPKTLTMQQALDLTRILWKSASEKEVRDAAKTDFARTFGTLYKNFSRIKSLSVPQASVGEEAHPSPVRGTRLALIRIAA